MTANPKSRALLLEAGGSDDKLLIKMPAAFTHAISHSKVDWGYISEPEEFLKGQRQSTSVAYLNPARNRKNLTVRTNALATRILFEGKRAKGVSYLKDGKIKQVHAHREVILCDLAVPLMAEHQISFEVYQKPFIEKTDIKSTLKTTTMASPKSKLNEAGNGEVLLSL